MSCFFLISVPCQWLKRISLHDSCASYQSSAFTIFYPQSDETRALVLLSQTSSVCPLCHTGIDATNGKSSGHEEPVDPNLHTTQDTSEIKHYDQPAEGNDENEADDQKETKQEQKHKLDQSQEHENDEEMAATVQPQHQQEAVPDQEEARHESETCSDSVEPEDTEQVETFFSTMSHRYENAIQEGHILQDTLLYEVTV